MSETEVNNGQAEDLKEVKAQAEEAMDEAKEAMAEADEAMAEVKEIHEEVEELKEEVSAEQKELAEFKEKFYYVAAEMENMKKRHERDMQNQLKYGNEKVLKGLLDVVDNLERTLMAIENDEDAKVKNIFVGVDMVKGQFLEVLKNNGLEQIEALGKTFDPNFHEAMAQQPAEGKENDEVIQVYQQGYTLNGRLLRAAKVVIAKN
ncbi:nucleotide exchange factor GrpE [Bacteriovorax sp. DB6_IX]|uniref:nucleotide exchange factor GrpE n=1 Tax=Bacteriovorax sp. DB6_IX TaxID=1353530 RepID=UPI00038A2D64|nr:nucleotide exchange factor GrpE [Bacteriovorax sp. DB6_IX]EQC49740.1 co-chaperone GrpE [Bacteriovorax sp. DB6_IX]